MRYCTERKANGTYTKSSLFSLEGALPTFPQWFQVIFGQSPTVTATVFAVVFNIMLPKQQKEFFNEKSHP
ncbi:MAG: hypothetical protein PHR69_09940 [Sphaerochaeta sp.]|nr:hypothetical protein [Sphaerochaeta sp.]